MPSGAIDYSATLWLKSIFGPMLMCLNISTSVATARSILDYQLRPAASQDRCCTARSITSQNPNHPIRTDFGPLVAKFALESKLLDDCLWSWLASKTNRSNRCFGECELLGRHHFDTFFAQLPKLNTPSRLLEVNNKLNLDR